MSNRAIATSTLWQMASQIAMAALSIVTVKFVTMGLSMELAGYYNSAYGYLQIFGILADFGLYAVAVRELAASKDRERTFGTLFTLRAIILMISLGSALTVAWLVPAWQGTPLPLGITIAAFVPFFTLLAGMIRTIFQVEYRMRYVFIAEVMQRVLTVSATGLLIWWFALDHSEDVGMYALFMLVGSAGAALLLLLSIIYGSRFLAIRPHFDARLLKATLAKAAPYGLAFLCMALYRQFDVTMIALLRDDFAVQNAYYGFVQRMMDMAYLLPTFLLNSTLPVLSERDAKGEDTRSLLGKTFFIVLLIASTELLFSALWSRPLMQLLTNESYLSANGMPGSDTALMLLSVSMFLNAIVLFSFYSLLTKHAWKPLVLTLCAGAALSFILNLLWIPTLGFVGACYTSIAVHAFLAVCLLPQSLRVMGIHFPRLYLAQWLEYTALLGIAVWAASPYLTSSWHTAAALGLAVPVMAGIAGLTGLRASLGKG